MSKAEIEPQRESEEPEPPFSSRHRICSPLGCGKPCYGGNKEALAWAVDVSGRSISFIGAAAFLASTLLRLAKEAAGCETEAPEGETQVPGCDGRIYGIKPSSFLTTYTVVIGLTSAALMPLMGSLVDFTPHRRLLGRYVSVVYCLLIFPQIFISENTWFMVAILQIFVAFVGWAHTLLAYAYLPELTSDEKVLNKFISSFTMVQYGSMVMFLVSIVGISYATGVFDNDVVVARLGVSVSFILTSGSFAYSWTHFDARPAANVLPERASIWTEGFKQLGRTSKRIYKEFPSLGWFYVAVAAGDAAIQSLATIAVTYQTDVMVLSSLENGITILILLLASVPGGFVSGWFVARFNNAKWSSVVSSLILIFSTFLASAILTGPGQQLRAYGVAAAWGLGSGWKSSSDKLMASALIPGGQDTELMGVYLFAGQCVTWLPPLIFTGLNEAGLSQRANIALLNIYFFISVISYLRMGRYDDALALAKANRIECPPPANENHAIEGALDSSNSATSQIEKSCQSDVMQIDM